MGDGFTELNPGQGGNFLDETTVTFGSPPVERRRERVHISGHLAEELAEVQNTPPTSSDYGLVTRPIFDGQKLTVGSENPGESVVTFGFVTLVAPLTETTVLSYIVPVTKTFHVSGCVSGGNVNALFRFYVNGVLLMIVRSSVANPTVNISFQLSCPTALAGQEVKVTAEHTGKNSKGITVLGDFETTILGYNT